MDPNLLKPTSSSGSLNPSSSHKIHNPHHHHHGSHHHQAGMPSEGPGGSSRGSGALHHSQLVVAVSNESKLYLMSSIEIKDPLETQLEDSFNKLQSLINPTSQTDGSNYNSLTHYAGQSKAHYDDLCSALLYSILTDPSTSSRCLRNLFLCNNMNGSAYPVNDLMSPTQPPQPHQYAVLISHLMNIITENYYRMKDQPRQQLLWLLRELVKARVNQCDKLLCQMLRNIQSGLLSDKNIWLAESLLDILSEQISSLNENAQQAAMAGGGSATGSPSLWIYTFNNNELMLQAVYTYIRLISDHGNLNHLNQLRQRETEFCIQILREKWFDCCQIGKDLVRLLQSVSKIPEFDQLWRDLIQSPQTLSPQFAQAGGLLYLLRMPTKRRYLISRLTVDMERKIYFLITNVKHGQQKRYLEWFQRQYLNTPESQSLRIDLMRYILVVVHPTNEQLNAGLTPRWAVCAWLLNNCTNVIDSANLKLALYYDWLVYDSKRDNIMLIEPAILLMYNSIRMNSNPSMPNTNSSMLFDFLCRVAVNYHPPLREHIVIGIQQAFKDCVDKRVIPSMQVFFDANIPMVQAGKPPMQQAQPVIDKDLKFLIQNTFGNFFQTMNLNPLPIKQEAAPSTVPPIKASNIPSPSAPGGAGSTISLGSTSSLFKRTTSNSSDSEPIMKQEPTESASSPLSSFQNKLTELSSADVRQTSQTLKFSQAKFEKIEAGVVDDSNSQQAFSSDEEDNTDSNQNDATENEELRSNMLLNIENENTNMSTKSATNTNNMTQSSLFTSQSNLLQFLFDLPGSSSSSSSITPNSLLNLEQKLKKFLKKPYKIFTTNEEQAVPMQQFSQSTQSSQSSSLISTNFENHLSLILSSELRGKLLELNEKMNSASESLESAEDKTKCIGLFKEVVELLVKNENDLTLSDIAACLCIVFRNEFNNNLLKVNCQSPVGFDEAAKFEAQKYQKLQDFYRFDIYSLPRNKNFLRYLYESFVHEGKVGASRKYWLFVCLFKELAQSQGSQRDLLIRLFNEIYLKQNRLGYYFLFYISSICLLSIRFGESLNGDQERKQPFAELVKKCKNLNDLTAPFIGSGLERNKTVTQLLACYRSFLNEQTKNTIGAVVSTIHGKNQISTYDSDLSDADQSRSSEENENDSSDESNDDVSDESDDDDGESEEKKAGNRSKHDENYSDEEDDASGDDASMGDDSDDSDQDMDDEDGGGDFQSRFSDESSEVNDEQAGKVLMQDLRLCQQDDPYLFAYMLPFVTNRSFLRPLNMSSQMMNSSELTYLIVSSIDAKMLREITALIQNKNLFLYQSVKTNRSSEKSEGKRANKNGRKRARSPSAKDGTTRKIQKRGGNAAKSKRTDASGKSMGSDSPSVDGGKKRKRATNDVKNKQIKKLKTTSGKDSLNKSAGKDSKGRKGSKGAETKPGAAKSGVQSDDTFAKLLSSSLEWESIEQSYFWELIRAHESLTKLTCSSKKVQDTDSTKSNARSTRSVVQANAQKSEQNEPPQSKMALTAINSKIYAKFFAKLSPIKHNEALLGLSSILKANKPNIYLINGILKRPMIDFNLVKSLLIHWLDIELEDNRSANVVHQTDLRYLFTILLVRSALLYNKFSTRQKPHAILAKASSLSISINKKDSADDLKSSVEELDDYDVVSLKQILDVLSRLSAQRKFRTKRFFSNYKLLFALKSTFARCFVSDEGKELTRRTSSSSARDETYETQNEWEDDDEFDYEDKAQNYDSDDETDKFTYSQQHSFLGKQNSVMKLARYSKLKEFALKELERFNKSPKDSEEEGSGVYTLRSKHFDGYKLDEELENFLVQAEEEELKTEELTKSIKAKSK